MKLIFILHLLVSPYISAYEKNLKCVSEFSEKRWRNYEDVKDYIRSLGIKTQKQFNEWRQAGGRPNDIPSRPDQVYQSEWVSWGEFLGTGNVHKKKFRSYESAQALMKALGIKTQKQFYEWRRAGRRLDDIPSRPDQIYQPEWINWGEFLGTGNINKKKFRSYESAQALMKALGIRLKDQFNEWSQAGGRPNDIPSRPDQVYQSEWINWGEFFGTGSGHKKKFRSYENAQAFMKALGIKTQKQFNEWSRSGERPSDIPSNPSRVYKTEWVSWGEFLGTENGHKKKFRSYESAQALMKALNIRSKEQFDKWCQAGGRPNDIPSRPDQVYQSEWMGWGEFLGTGNGHKKKFRSYESAQALMKVLGITTQKQFYEWRRARQRPDDIPFHPNKIYKLKWVGWSEFLNRQKPKQWMSYKQGQRYVQDMGIRTVKELIQWLESDERPDNFPPNPHVVWSPLWKSTQAFLKIKWVSFQQARAYVQLGGVTRKKEYYEFRISEDLTNELPPNPALVYAPYWKGWDDFLSYFE